MSENNGSYATGGITFLGLLQVAFIVLKLCNVIKWSWWLVLLPLWIEMGLVAIILIVALVLYLKYKHEDEDMKKQEYKFKRR